MQGSCWQNILELMNENRVTGAGAGSTPDQPTRRKKDRFSLKAAPSSWHLRGEDTAMDHENLVRRAAAGDVAAFVELTRRFQHFAFGSALALIRDFQQAEDVVQEAFMAAWSALPSLEDPDAFPGWLR